MTNRPCGGLFLIKISAKMRITMDKQKIGIIGGGVQGLSLAYFLSKNTKFSVSLFERNKNLGGLLGLLKIDGTYIEGFYHHLANHDRDIISLIKEIGLGENLIYAKSKIGIFYNDRIYPFSTPWDLLRFSPLNLLERLRVGIVSLYLRRLKKWEHLEKVSASVWLAKYMGRRAYEVIWEPLLRGKFGNHKDRISMAWVWNRIAWRAKTRTDNDRDEELVYPRGGFGLVVDRLAERIVGQGGQIFTEAAIESVEAADGRVAVTVGGQKEIFDKVFVTTPVNVFLRLTKGLPSDDLARLSRIKYRGAHVALLVLDRQFFQDGYYWVSVNDRALPMLAVVEHTNWAPKADYGGKTVLYIGNYPDPADPINQMDDGAVLKLYEEHLQKLNPDFHRGWIEKYWIFKDPNAQPVAEIGYQDIIPDYQTPIENLYLVTMAQIFPDDRGTNNSVRQAKEVIKEIFGV